MSNLQTYRPLTYELSLHCADIEIDLNNFVMSLL